MVNPRPKVFEVGFRHRGSKETVPETALSQVMADRLRERRRPQPGDEAFAHLFDLRQALAEALADARGLWLDFGSGTAPYRELLPGATLQTAELKGAEDFRPDHELDSEGRCAEPDGTFDGVLSTQVLEHVEDPDAYLREAWRLLRPGGGLVLSTHGVWEDHGGRDLWRWTADGLALQAERAGFTVDRSTKLTCGPRALLLLVRRHGREHGWPGKGLVGLILRGLALLDHLRPSAIDTYLQRVFTDQSTRPQDEETLYLDILLVARKPEETARPDSTHEGERK